MLSQPETVPLTINDLANWSPSQVAAAERTLSDDPVAGEELLLRLHFRRNSTDQGFRSGACAFCSLAYEQTADVRYFNELLWFSQSESVDDPPAAALFRSRLDRHGRHRFPLTRPGHVADGARRTSSGRPLRIGLYGYPHAFVRLAEQLESDGHAVVAISIPHGARNLARRVMETPGVRNIAAVALGWRRGFRSAPYDYHDPRLGDFVRASELDVAVHRLGIIIKNNLINNSGRGILNDHLALLPAVRGRSSVEFSLLHGIPVGATVHFVDEGVDTGAIVRRWSYRLSEIQPRSVADIKAAVIAKSDERFRAAIADLQQPDFVVEPNPHDQGLRYYSMAPALERHVSAMLPTWTSLD